MYYFASDVHLGLSVGNDPAERERLFVRWLDEIAPDADAIFLVGDIFDFWYEYRHVVPKGFTRLLGKLSELSDRGIPVHLFAGNHDMWAFRYLHDECGITLHAGPYEIFELYGRRVLIGHGDVLGQRPCSQRWLSRIFRSRWIQGLYYLIHPDLSMSFGQGWSHSNRTSRPIAHTFRGEKEPIVGFAREMLHRQPIDLFVCGHIHCAEYYPLDANSAIVFLGEWIESPVYGVLTPDGFQLKPYS